MTELKDALNRIDHFGHPPIAADLRLIVEAARKVTSPDYLAAALVKVGDPCDMDGKRDQVNEWFTRRDIQAIVDAALQ